MSLAIVHRIAGPVLHARRNGPFGLREAVRVGPQSLLGEVVAIHDDDIVVQVYEDTAGLRPGTAVHGDGQPLAIRVGPALLGRIFDGLLRPLAGADTPFVRPGMRGAAPAAFRFEPRVARGDAIRGGAVIGEAIGANGHRQACLAPPLVEGEVVSALAAGKHTDDETVVVVRDASGSEL
ncbi:MAG TPA: hypothetical protein VLE45_07405, partial [Burkholderiaceae bacterium]|nr:hypothetical protein [Burkholderiaceae bacterium]